MFGQMNPLLTSTNPSPVFGNTASSTQTTSNIPTSISSITQGLSGLNTTGGSITQGIPPTNLQLELRQQEDTIQYSPSTPPSSAASSQNYPYHVHHILNIHNHRSLTNSPISNPGSPGLDMIQEEMIHQQHGVCCGIGGNKQDTLQQQQSSICHPQISVTDVLGE